MSKANKSVVFEARTAHRLRVSAQVTDAEFVLMLDGLTEVIAETTEDPNQFKIAWPYGVISASATVHRNSLIFV